MTLHVLNFRAGRLVERSVHHDIQAAASAFWTAVLSARREAFRSSAPCRAELWKDGMAIAIENVPGPVDDWIPSRRTLH